MVGVVIETLHRYASAGSVPPATITETSNTLKGLNSCHLKAVACPSRRSLHDSGKERPPVRQTGKAQGEQKMPRALSPNDCTEFVHTRFSSEIGLQELDVGVTRMDFIGPSLGTR